MSRKVIIKNLKHPDFEEGNVVILLSKSEETYMGVVCEKTDEYINIRCCVRANKIFQIQFEDIKGWRNLSNAQTLSLARNLLEHIGIEI